MDNNGQPQMTKEPKWTNATIDGLIKVLLDSPHPEGVDDLTVFYDALSREFPNMTFSQKADLSRKFSAFCDAYVRLSTEALEYSK